MAFPKRPGGSASPRALRAELEAKPAYADIRVIGVDDNQREIIRVDRRARTERSRRFRTRIGTEGRQGLFQANDQAADRRNLCLAADAGSARRAPHMPPDRRCGWRRRSSHPAANCSGYFIITVDMRPAFDRVRSSARSGRKRLRDRRTRRLSRSSRPIPRVRLHAGQADQLAERLPFYRRIARHDAGRLAESWPIRPDSRAQSRLCRDAGRQ